MRYLTVPYAAGHLPPQDHFVQSEPMLSQDHVGAPSHALNGAAHPPPSSINSGDFQGVSDIRQGNGDDQGSGGLAPHPGDSASPAGSYAFGHLPNQSPALVQYGLLKFLQTNPDDPWNPMPKFGAPARIHEQLGTAQPFAFPLSQSVPHAFTDYRDVAPPSECGTIGATALASELDFVGVSPPGRSGARSMGRAFSNSSVCDLDNSETRSLAGNLSAFNFQQGLFLGTSPTGSHEVREMATRSDMMTGPEDMHLLCQHCGSVVKTPSELKKHKQRHEKPHHCDVAGCKRKEGFSTLNDLHRHKVCVHHLSGTKYRCNLGSCATKTKEWPRADNFRSHLKRLHKDVDSDMDLQCFVIPPSESSIMITPDPCEEHTAQSSLTPFAATMSQPTWTSSEQGDVDNLASANNFSMGSSLDQNGSVSGFTAPPCLDHGSTLSVVTNSAEVQFPFTDSDLQSVAADSSLAYGSMPLTDSPSLIQVHAPDGYVGLAIAEQHTCSPNLLSHAGMDAFSTAFNHVEDPPNRMDELGLEGAGPAVFTRGLDNEMDAGGRLGETIASPQGPQQVADTAVPCSPSSAQQREILSHASSPTSSSCSEGDISSGSSSTRSTSTSVSGKQNKAKSYDEHQAIALVESLLIKKGLLDKVMSKFGYQVAQRSPGDHAAEDLPDGDLEVESSPTLSKSSANKPGILGENSKDRFRCGQCSKSFQRMCELRKHHKRHEKPYKCQFPECQWKFGSKNDWKRHENSQHMQQEFIVCRTELHHGPRARCNKVVFRQETFEHHVRSEHAIKDPKLAQKALVRGRSHPDNKVEYACSTCSQPIQTLELSNDSRDVYVADHVCAHGAPQATDEKDSAANLPLEPDALHSQQSSTRISKRPRDSDRDGTSSVRKRARGEFVWYCCQCQGLASLAMNTSCVNANCLHHQCEHCTVEKITPPDKHGSLDVSIEVQE